MACFKDHNIPGILFVTMQGSSSANNRMKADPGKKPLLFYGSEPSPSFSIVMTDCLTILRKIL